jgi:hypothetical protein
VQHDGSRDHLDTVVCWPSSVPARGADPAEMTRSPCCLILNQCWVCCHGVVGMTGCGSGGWGVCGGWVVWAVFRLVWKAIVSSPSRCSVPMLVYRAPCWAHCSVSVIAWVSSGCALISMNV